jgi:hypothetical protein
MILRKGNQVPSFGGNIGQNVLSAVKYNCQLHFLFC